MFWQLLANGLVTGSVLAIGAAGVSVVYGILRLVNFAYGDFMAFGALAAYAFNGPLGLGMVPSTLLGMLLTGKLHARKIHIALSVLFGIAWAGTFVTGIFFLPVRS